MPRENFSHHPSVDSHSSDKAPVKGDGFTMEEGRLFSRPAGPGLEFRPGETNESALAREEIDEAKRKRRRAEQQKKEAAMTPQEKAEQAAEIARDSRDSIAEWFEERLADTSEYTETLIIEKDGRLNRNKRLPDSKVPFIVNTGDLRSSEDLYQLARIISQEYPQFNFSFEEDPAKQWIRYRVTKTG